MKRTSWLSTTLALGAVFTASAGFGDDDPSSGTAAASREPALTMTPAVACSSIEGYEDYEVLPGAALTSDEKLLVYYRPLNYRAKKIGSTYHIHLVQDGQIRRRGEKAVLLIKLKILDYEWKDKQPPVLSVFMRNTMALKDLKPGDYEYDIILHDMTAPGEPIARQSLSFRVVPPGLRNEKGDVKPSEDRPTPP